MLAAIAAQVTGILIGFLFGLPQAVTPSQSSPQARYLPSANLPEVSDWLTKLLLGAGLVQLTHLGRHRGRRGPITTTPTGACDDNRPDQAAESRYAGAS